MTRTMLAFLLLLSSSLALSGYDEEGKLELDPDWKCSLDSQKLSSNDYPITRGAAKSGKINCQRPDGKAAFYAVLKSGNILNEKIFNHEGKIEQESLFQSDGTVLKIIYDSYSGKKQTERSYNTKAQYEGISKFYYPSGKVEIEESYKHGELEGMKRSYDEEGRIKEVSWNKNGQTILSYWKDPLSSKLLRIECEKNTESPYPEHQKYCGFPGQSQVFELYGLVDGKLQVERKVAFTRGVISYEEKWSEGKIKMRTEQSDSQVTEWVYDEEGNIKELSVSLPYKDSALMTLTYEGGKLSRVECGKKAYRREDDEACGFTKQVDVSLYEFIPGTKNLRVHSIVTMKNGKVLKSVENIGDQKREMDTSSKTTREKYPDGSIKSEKGCDRGSCYEKKMFPDGKISYEFQSKPSGVELKEYYQNGKMKRFIESEGKEGHKSVKEERYDDQGRLTYSGEKIVKGDFTETGLRIGLHKEFSEGVIRTESIYTSRGELQKKLDFDKLGKPIQEETYQNNLLLTRTLIKDGKRLPTKKFHPDGSLAQ